MIRAESKGSSRSKLTDGLVNTKDQATSLGSGKNGIDLDKRRLPNKGLHVVPDALVVKVNTSPNVALAVLNTQAVKDISGIETGIVAKLARNDLESLGKGLDDTLLLVWDVGVGVCVQVFRDFHFAGTTTGDNVLVLDGALDDHDGIVQGALDLGDELVGTTTEDESAGLCCRAALEEVETLATDLAFFEDITGSEVSGLNVGAGGLDRCACCLADTLEVVRGNTASTEDVAVSKESGCVSIPVTIVQAIQTYWVARSPMGNLLRMIFAPVL